MSAEYFAVPDDDWPGPPAAGVMYLCPVNGCPWRHAQTRMEDVGMVWRHSVDESVRATIMAGDQRDEAAVRDHLTEHSVVDFARTIMELRVELAAARGETRERAG